MLAFYIKILDFKTWLDPAKLFYFPVSKPCKSWENQSSPGLKIDKLIVPVATILCGTTMSLVVSTQI
jgi:hypothetical protein